MDTPLQIADNDTFFADCPIPARIFELRGFVTRVLDGDTCVAWLDMGDGQLLVTKIRYEDLNAPELTETGGRLSRDFNVSLVYRKWVTIQTRMRREQSGRLLASVFVWNGKNVPLTDVTKAIIEAGHGTKR